MPTRYFAPRAIAAALCFLTASPATWAQASADEDSMPDSDAAAQELETVNVTASAMQTTTGMALTPQQTPQSVTLVPQAQLQDQGITSVHEALKNTTGVNVIRDGNRYRYQSRGFYINQIEEDGVATTVAAGASGNPYRDPQSTSDLAIYEHIEVVRGATGLTQANSEPGGTINAVRKKPTTHTRAELDVTADQRGSVRLVGDVSGSVNAAQTVRSRLVFVGDRHESFKDDVGSRQGLIYGVVDARLGSNTMLTVGGLYQKQRETPDLFGVPMGLGGVSAGLPRDAYLGFDWSRSEFTKKNLFAELEHALGDNWMLTTKLNHIDSDSQSRFGALANSSTSFAGLAAGDTIATNNLGRYDNSGKQTAVQANLAGQYELLGRRHDLFVTYAWSNEKTNTRWRRVRERSAFDPFTFQGDEIAQPDWDADYDDQTFYGNKVASHGLTLGTRINPTEALHVILGGRYTRWKQSGFTDYDWWNGVADSDEDTTSANQRNRFVPYLGVTYDLTPASSLYASYTSIFQPQSSTNLEGAVLPPVIGTNYEVGIKSGFFDKRLNTTLALFQIEQKNRAISLQDEASGRWYAEPAGKVQSRGLDAEVAGYVTPNWQLFAGYTYNTSKYLETETSLRQAGMNFSKHTPRHMLRLYTSYRLPGNAWTLGAGINAQSRTSSIYNVEQGGYAIFNANAQYQFNRNARLTLMVHNLTDRRYYENHRVRTNGINNFYGTPRTVSLNLRWTM